MKVCLVNFVSFLFHTIIYYALNVTGICSFIFTALNLDDICYKERSIIPCREIASGRLDFPHHLWHANSRCTCHDQAIDEYQLVRSSELSPPHPIALDLLPITSTTVSDVWNQPGYAMMYMIRVSIHGPRQPFNRITDRIFWQSLPNPPLHRSVLIFYWVDTFSIVLYDCKIAFIVT